ncbi:MAG: hypothetical protein C0605_16100 [Hyphomicrobiales bacterium]|nr:MAG: hypothetical protein C0605_16100 [Hyphomicrobiales bacterium]
METETVAPSVEKQKKRTFWRDTSLLRKYIVYARALMTKTALKEFGIPKFFHVLTVTTTPGHMKAIQEEAYRKNLSRRPLSAEPRQFIFGNFQTIAEHDNDIFNMPFEDGMGERFWL